MLYPTLNQPLVLLAIFACGIVGGLIFDVAKILTALSGNDNFSRHLFDFFATCLAFFALFVVNMWINYGRFRIYVLFVYLLSFALERLISKFLWTKLIARWYSSIMRRKARDERKKEKSF